MPPLIPRALRSAFPRTLPVMAGYLVLGFGFGVLLASRGYAFYWGLLMSLCVYAGAMQYVAIDLLTGGASLLSAALMTLLINARHLFYGLSMLEPYRGTGRKKPYLIFSLTDETYSLLCRGEVPAGVDKGWYFFFVSALDQGYWVLGSLLGSLAGEYLPFPARGIEFSMTALFAVIFTQQWLTSRDHRPALIGLFSALLCLLVFGPGRFILPAMGLIGLCLILLRPSLPEGGEGGAL
ncbi:MAG: AzlC family ABC transporter permease [Christensenellales bacterium]